MLYVGSHLVWVNLLAVLCETSGASEFGIACDSLQSDREHVLAGSGVVSRRPAWTAAMCMRMSRKATTEDIEPEAVVVNINAWMMSPENSTPALSAAACISDWSSVVSIDDPHNAVG